MLLSLSLRDFVIVEALQLDFSGGFTVMTGETGAGKSILLDALALVLGRRSDAGAVREGRDRADLSAVFSLTEPAAGWLADNGFDVEDNEVLLRRIVDASGRSRAWIQGVPATAGQLRELGALLVDIHGQNAHQSLLQPAGQMALLDAYAGHDDLLAACRETYDAWRAAKMRWESAVAERERRAERIERLAWMREELENLDPKAGEWAKLNAEHSRLAHAASIREELGDVLGILTQGSESAYDALSSAIGRIDVLTRYDEKLGALMETLGAAQDLVREAAHEAERYLDREEIDEERFEKVDRRVGRYFDLSRKFRTEPERLHALRERVLRELAQCDEEGDIEALKRKMDDAEALCREAAEKLSRSRRKHAEVLSAAVTAEMQRLSMKGGAFRVAFESISLSAHGAEQAVFMVAGHAGVALRPLQKTASGGELARISLAVAVITARVTPVPTLVFDEVDTGIGGATAEVVGRLLRRLSRDRQVLCITHLPQVAACGDQHFRISKETISNVTTSAVTLLNEVSRIEEIARMMSGHAMQHDMLQAARTMISLANQLPDAAGR